MGKIQVFISNVAGNRVAVDIEPEKTIAELTQMYCLAEGIDANTIRLVFNSKELSNENTEKNTLFDNHIQNGSVIWCVQRLQGGCELEL